MKHKKTDIHWIYKIYKYKMWPINIGKQAKGHSHSIGS